MGQANECGSVETMENFIYTWYFVWAFESASHTSHIHGSHPLKQSTTKKHRVQKMINSKQI